MSENINAIKKPNSIYVLCILMSSVFVNMQPLTNHLSLIIAILFGVMLFLVLILLDKSGSEIVLKKYLFIPLSMIIFFSISLISSLNMEQSLKYILFYIITLFFMSILTKDTKWFTLLCSIQLATSIVHALITLLSYFNTDLYIRFFYPFLSEASKRFTYAYIYRFNFHAGIAGQTGTNGFFMSIGLSIVFVNLLVGKRRFKVSNIILFIMFSLSLFVTGKRGFILANFIAMIITYYYSQDTLKNKTKKYLKYIIGLITMIIIIYLSYMFIPAVGSALDRFFISNSTSGDISSGRFGLYNLAWETFVDNPIIGVGIDTFTYIPYSGVQQNVGAHNDWLQFLAEIGAVGSMFLMYFVLMTLRKTINLIKDNTFDKCYKPFIFISLYSQSYILFHSLVGMPFHNYSMLLTYIIFASIPYAVTNKIKKNLYIEVSK